MIVAGKKPKVFIECFLRKFDANEVKEAQDFVNGISLVEGIAGVIECFEVTRPGFCVVVLVFSIKQLMRYLAFIGLAFDVDKRTFGEVVDPSFADGKTVCHRWIFCVSLIEGTGLAIQLQWV